MAHFAKLDTNNKVIDVTVVSNNVITIDGQESEQAGIDFLRELTGHPWWKQTSYNGSFRGRYAGIDFLYIEESNVFVPPKPHFSWVLNTEKTAWVAPTPKPVVEGKTFDWYEPNREWIEITIYNN